MNERSYTFNDFDKATWGDGPWQHEPDKVVWVDDATGLDCMIVRNRHGALCGYVGLPEGHRWHGEDYSVPDVAVHGGLTFASPCQEGAMENEHAICHSVASGRPDNVWWLGFDCAHAWDLTPAIRAFDKEHGLSDSYRKDDVYRDLDYVRAEVASLAHQVAG